MEWRVQTSVSCAEAFIEAQRWIEGVTGKSFGCKDFRAALENGVLLCDLINQLKPGIIKRVNRLSTPIAGLDNVNVFLKACDKLGLNESQLFHPGDLQDVSTRVTVRRDESNRRLKNVLITIYWLGRKAHLDTFYSGPQLNFKAFEGLLGLALSKALDEGSNVFVKDGGSREGWSLEREERERMRPSYRRVNSVDGDSLDTHALRPNSEGCGSDAEAEQVFRMETSQPPVRQSKGYIPPPLRRKQGREENGRGYASPITRENENKVRPERLVQVNPGWIWSKSLSDIPMVYPVRKLPRESTILDVSLDTGATEEWNQQSAQRSGAGTTDSEAQWQDDLTKWKNRRRSTKSDHRRKSLDREHVINQMTNGAVTNLKSDAQGVRVLKRDHQSPRGSDRAPDPHSTSPPSKSSSSGLRPHTRALLARSYATEAPFCPAATLNPQNSAHTQRPSVGVMPAADVEEETPLSSLASDGAEVTTPSLDSPFSSQTQVKAQGFPAHFQSSTDPPQPVSSNQISTLVTTLHPKEPTKSISIRSPTGSMSNNKEVQPCVDTTFCPDAVNQTTAFALTDMSHQNHKTKEEQNKTSWEPAVDQGRGQPAAGVYKYLSRTATWSGSASLPRGYRRSESSSRLSSAITARPFGTKQSRVSSLPRMCNVDDNQGLLLNREKEEFLSPTTKSSLKRQTAASHLRNQNQASVRQKDSQAKQNSTEQDEEGKVDGVSRQTNSDTNGYHHQPNTQTHHYKSPTLPTTKVDHSNMRVSLTLKPNSRPDFGFQTHWDSTGARVKYIQLGSPAELCQLCVDDEIVAVDGVAVMRMTYSQWQDKMTSALHTGSLTMDIRRYGNKDWSTNEAGHHKQPGQSRMTLNLTAAAPVLIACPDHHANGTAPPETAKALTFNGEAKNVMQGTVMNGGLPVSHRPSTGSKGGSETAISDLQVPSLSSSSTSWSWDHEEHRRRQEKWQEEQERLLQERYQRDQERLEAEWQRAQQDAVGDLSRKSGIDSPASSYLHTTSANHKTGEEEPRLDTDEMKEAGSKPGSNAQAAHSGSITEQDWAVDSCGFAQLSAAHRAKSLSTPALAASHNQTRGDRKKRKGQSLSKAELDRQQILEEMKKRTPLLTDNSWIRQRSSSLYKEPAHAGVALKRYESLDNLDTLRESTVVTGAFVYPRPHSAAAGYCGPSRNPSSRYSAGPILSHRNGSADPLHLSSVWAATNISEEVKPESRFKSETGSDAIPMSSTLVSPLDDQHALLQITE